jgi:hypothetical protein
VSAFLPLACSARDAGLPPACPRSRIVGERAPWLPVVRRAWIQPGNSGELASGPPRRSQLLLPSGCGSVSVRPTSVIRGNLTPDRHRRRSGRSGKTAGRWKLRATAPALDPTSPVGQIEERKWVLRQLMAKDGIVRVGNNLTAFRGGFRLCIDDVQTLDVHGLQPPASRPSRGEWRLL